MDETEILAFIFVGAAALYLGWYYLRRRKKGKGSCCEKDCGTSPRK